MEYPVDYHRENLSAKYIKGSGIEIGALCHPLKVVDGVAVKYIDRFDRDGLHEQYPAIPVEEMCPVDLVDDGEHLETIANSSQDFVIANHFLEHCKNPIKTIENWLRVLKPGGIIFCAIPDKTKCFDRNRPNTEWEHIFNEYKTGETNDEQHYRENGIDPSTNYSIHYHCWDFEAFKNLLTRLKETLPIEVVEFMYKDFREEFIFIGKKI
jgi:SAM-dependent methyltransferase